MFEQDRLLVRFQQLVDREADILTCFLSGSYGRGTQDRFSDLDVALVFAGRLNREAAYQRRVEFAKSVLPYVASISFDATHVRPYLHIALYSNGAKVDFRYETRDSLEPNPWDREIRLIKDTDGWGERFQAASAALPPIIPRPTITSDILADLNKRFWVMFMDIYRQLLRGDYDRPYPIYLELVYFTVPELLSLLPPEDPAHQGLIQASFSQDTKATLAHLRSLLDAYLAAREAVIRRHNLGFVADDIFERELRKRLR